MKVKKTHMIFLLILIGSVCIVGGNTIEGLEERSLIGGNPSTWGPPLKRERERKAVGKDPATWGPPLDKKRRNIETPAEKMIKFFFIGLLLFLLFSFYSKLS